MADDTQQYAPKKGPSLAELSQARQQMLDRQKVVNQELTAVAAEIAHYEDAYKKAAAAGDATAKATAKQSLAAAKTTQREVRGEQKDVETGLGQNMTAGQKAYGEAGGGAGKAMAMLARSAELATIGMEMLAGIKVAEGMEKFIGALNPSAVQVFDRALNDLSAVVGTALMPVFSVVTQAVKQFGNLLMPLAQELAPVFGQIASTVMQVLQPVMQVVVNMFRLATPALQLFADVLSTVAPLLQMQQTVWAAIIQTVSDGFASLFGSGYKDAMTGAQTAMQKLANYAVITAGALAKLAASAGFSPGNAFLKNLIEAAKGGRQTSTEGLGAATQGRVTDIRAYEREQMAAAFTATQGTAVGKRQEDYLAEAVATLEKIQDGSLDAKEALRQVGREIVAGVREGIGKILEKMGFKDTYEGAEKAATGIGMAWDVVAAPWRGWR